MLSRFDDYPIHQIAVPIAQAGGGHPDFYDRFWFNGYTDDTFFALAMGCYPNRGVMDAAFSVVHDGVQRSVFTSGRAPDDRSVTAIGPIRVEIVEPMRSARIVVDAPDHELAADLRFEARTAAYEEPRQAHHQGARLQLDLTRATQFGTWTGSTQAGTATVALPATVFGTKDRSWGIRPVGQPAPMAPLPGSGQVCFLWAPINFDDAALHYIAFEDADGRAWSEGGAIVPTIGPGEPTVGPSCRVEHIDDVDLAIEWEPGLRRARHATLSFTASDDGAPQRVDLEPQLTFRMSGVGYTHPTWGHGRWHDELVVGGESFGVDELDDTQLRNVHVQQVMRATWGERRGLGVLEQFVLGPHRTRGLDGLTTGYRP